MIDWSNIDQASLVTARAAIDAEMQDSKPDLQITVKDVLEALGETQVVSIEGTDEGSMFRAGAIHVTGMLICAARERAKDTEFRKRFEEELVKYARMNQPMH